jgi:hypothetical protein
MLWMIKERHELRVRMPLNSKSSSSSWIRPYVVCSVLFLRVCWSVHLNCGRPVFRFLFGFCVRRFKIVCTFKPRGQRNRHFDAGLKFCSYNDYVFFSWYLRKKIIIIKWTVWAMHHSQTVKHYWLKFGLGNRSSWLRFIAIYLSSYK